MSVLPERDWDGEHPWTLPANLQFNVNHHLLGACDVGSCNPPSPKISVSVIVPNETADGITYTDRHSSRRFEMADKSAFSIDAILARDGSPCTDRIAGDHTVMIGYGNLRASNSTSVDNAWLRQVFTDLARRLLVADTCRRSPSTCREKEPEQATNNISTLIESNLFHPYCFPSWEHPNSWLEQRRHSINDVEAVTRSQRSTSLQQGSRSHKEEQSHQNGLHATGVDHSSQLQRRLEEQNVVDGRHRPQSPARNDVDAVSCYFDEDSETKADGVSRAAWSTGLYLDMHESGRDASPRRPSYRSATCNLEDVKKDYSTAETDPTLLWRLARPFTG